MLDYLIPQEVETVSSQFNGEIKVLKDKGKFLLYVDAYQQSGPWVKKIWTRGLNNSAIKQCNNVLVLGLGAGVVIPIINKHFPNAQIIGVEIDPVMIDLGRKYFNLNHLSNLSILSSDAQSFLKTNHQTFDLILVDLYLGKNISSQTEENSFLKSLSQTLSKNGRIIFNTLTTKTSPFVLKDFVDKLADFFKIEKKIKIDFNTLVFCSRK